MAWPSCGDAWTGCCSSPGDPDPGQLREYIRTVRSCAPGLARLGPETGLLRQPAATAKRACRNYERAAAVYQRVAPLLGVGTDQVGDLLQQAGEHQGNGSNGLRQAESDARLILA